MKTYETRLTRRNVVANATVLLPWAAIRGTAANSSVSVGLLGSGNRGPYVAAALAKNTPGRITALCDLFSEKMERAKSVIGVENPKTYTDFHEMLASDVDAVIIATPVYLHPDHLEAAIKAGKHIYIEKPAAADVEGCKRVMRLADGADRKLNITFGFQRRYAQVYRKARKAVADGAIGPIRLAQAYFIKSGGPTMNVQQAPRPTTDKDKLASWYSWKELSGDLIVENNVHVIDVLNWFLDGHPKSAIGAGGATLPKRGDMRDHNFVAYEYDKGVQGQLSGTTLAPRGYRHVVEQFYGELGMIETSETHWRHFQNPQNDITEKSPRNITIDSVSEFVARIAEGHPENVGARGAESTLTAILGRMAMDARREVTWDEMMKG